MADRIELMLLDQHAGARTLHAQRNERVRAGLRVQNPQERLGIDRDRLGRLVQASDRRRTAGIRPFARSRRASFFPNPSRMSASSVASINQMPWLPNAQCLHK